MAAYLFHFNPLFKKFTGNIFNETIGSVRNIYQTKKKIPTLKYGYNNRERLFLKAGALIHYQKKIKLCPGLNVGVNKTGCLYAKLPGRLYVTKEKTNFNPSNPFVRWQFPDNHPPYKKYLNVIPEPQSQAFKLVEKF